MGHTLSGFYDVKGSNTQISSAYCDFSKASSDPGYETRYGFVDVKSSPVHFFVTRYSGWSKVGIIPFEKEYLNLGGGMNTTSGIFTVPKTGIYTFSFKGEGYGTGPGYAGSGWVLLKRNDETVADGVSTVFNAPSYSFSTLSVHGTLKLHKGDAITIYLLGGAITSNGQWPQFMGSLLEEELVIS